MRRIVERHGKFYTEEIRVVGQVDLPQLGDQLADVKMQKEAALAKEAAGYDDIIAEVENQIAEMKKLQGKPAKSPNKPRREKRPAKKAGTPKEGEPQPGTPDGPFFIQCIF